MPRSAPLLVLLLLIGAPVSGAAQGTGCTAAEIRDGEILQVLDRGTPFERIVISGGARITCGTDVELRADSAISYPATGERRFVGRVFYSDSLKTLTADRVDYDDVQGRLVARGQVVLTDRKTGSVIRGAALDYLRAREERPEATTIVSGRPHATLYQRKEATPGDPAAGPAPGRSAPQAAPGDSASPPLEVDADRMEIRGERLFRAFGRVELVRGETRGFGEEAEYDQIDDRMVLTGDARVEGEAFSLSAHRVEATTDGEKLRDVFAEHEAVAVSDELRVESPALRLVFADGELSRMIAMRRAGEAEGPASPKPRAMAEEFWLTADSLDALAPGQKLQQVLAIGNAYGERVADSLDARLPAAIARDWLRGDTITGFFKERPVAENGEGPGGAAAGDSARARAVLDRLVAVGAEGRARSLYRIREEKAPDAPPSVNYLVANRIVLTMHEGQVKEVEAEGPVEGIHLQPEDGKAAKPGPPRGPVAAPVPGS